MTFEELHSKVVQWGQDRGIILNAPAHVQLLKAVSEMGELADAEIKQQTHEAKDAVGDVLVCLIMYCSIKGFDMTTCLWQAYNEIKDRKGFLLPNGTFVKEAA